MSDDLERIRSEIEITEGVIVDEQPLTDADEARALVIEGLTHINHGGQVLALAERRLAWKVLGFTSMNECITYLAQSIKITIEPAVRVSFAAQLRMNNMSSDDIATTMGINIATANRLLSSGRESGLLDDEPEKVVARDGRSRPTTRSASARPARSPRPDLAKTWLNGMDDLNKRIRGIRAIREEDDRYATRLPDLVRSLGDIQTAIVVLSQVVEDFQIVTRPPE